MEIDSKTLLRSN